MKKMDVLNLHDINEYDTLVLHASKEDKSVDVNLRSDIISDEEHKQLRSKIKTPYIPLQVVTHEWKERMVIVSFIQSKAKLTLYVTRDSITYMWEDVKIGVLKFSNGKKEHVLITKRLNGTPYNRRKGVRIDILQDIEVVQGDSEPFYGFLKDLSFCGAGIIVEKEQTINKQLPLLVTFGEYEVKLMVKREENLGNNRKLLGCAVDPIYYDSLQKFLAKKQVIRSNSDDIAFNSTDSDWKIKAAWKMQAASGLKTDD